MSREKKTVLTREFPYKDKYTTKDEIYDRFEKIQLLKPKFVTEFYTIKNLPDFSSDELVYLGEPKILVVPADFDTDDISDFFFEDVRGEARRFDERYNLFDWWDLHGWKYTPSQAKKSRERIYKKYHEVTTFRPSVIAGMIDFLKVKSVLDFSAGWGDRLIGALSKNIDKYTGIDPNKKLKYEQIKPFFEKEFEINTKVKFYHQPAEKVVLPKHDQYDMIFTSPPYFDLEVYTDDSTQSIYKRNLSEWLNDFLLDTVYNLIPHVTKYIVLIINDPYVGPRYVRKMLQEMSRWRELEYLGVISYAKPDLTSPQPMWIWRVL